jgi:RNase P/RNase MRP subunit p29
MNELESLVGSYCKIVISQTASERGIVQSGFVRSVDTTNNTLILENEDGVVQCSLDEIRAIKKIRVMESG